MKQFIKDQISNLPDMHKTIIFIFIISNLTFLLNSWFSSDPELEKVKMNHEIAMEKARFAERDKFIKKGYGPISLSCMEDKYKSSVQKEICRDIPANDK